MGLEMEMEAGGSSRSGSNGSTVVVVVVALETLDERWVCSSTRSHGCPLLPVFSGVQDDAAGGRSIDRSKKMVAVVVRGSGLLCLR